MPSYFFRGARAPSSSEQTTTTFSPAAPDADDGEALCHGLRARGTQSWMLPFPGFGSFPVNFLPAGRFFSFSFATGPGFS